MSRRPSNIARCVLNKIKLAFVGTGDLMLKYYLPEAKEHPELFDIVGICDVDSERAESLARFVGAPEWFGDYTDLVAHSSAELVVIVTPPDLNYPLALAGLESGKHIYVEKPFARTLADANHLLQTATNFGVQIMAAPTLMLDPSNALIRSLISNGSIGRVGFVSMPAAQAGDAASGHYNRFVQLLTQEGITLANLPEENRDIPWYFNKGGGPAFDATVNAITRMTGLIGPARRVAAFSGLSAAHREILLTTEREDLIPAAHDDTTLLLLDFGESRFGHISSSWFGQASKTPALEIIGSEGTIAVTSTSDLMVGEQETVVHLFHNKAAKWEELPLTEGLWRIPTGLIHFAHSLLEDKRPDISIEQARHVVEVIEKTYFAAQSGQALDIATTF